MYSVWRYHHLLSHLPIISFLTCLHLILNTVPPVTFPSFISFSFYVRTPDRTCWFSIKGRRNAWFHGKKHRIRQVRQPCTGLLCDWQEKRHHKSTVMSWQKHFIISPYVGIKRDLWWQNAMSHWHHRIWYPKIKEEIVHKKEKGSSCKTREGEKVQQPWFPHSLWLNDRQTW